MGPVTLKQRDSPEVHRGEAALNMLTPISQTATMREGTGSSARAGAYDDVGLMPLPSRERAAVVMPFGQRRAPVPREVPPVVELERDARVVVGGEGVLADARGQRVDAPRPFEECAGSMASATGLRTMPAVASARRAIVGAPSLAAP